MNRHIFVLFGVTIWLIACPPPFRQKTAAVVTETSTPVHSIEVDMNRDTLFDKVYGMLLGTAIGDAMGAPTEMWERRQMQIEYGHIQGLDSMVREPSGEGIWDYNLPAGSTTDDTRWKALLVDYLCGVPGQLRSFRQELDPRSFARFILNRYERELQGFR
ncbi:MAG: ADP-ribosylglycohydrolase family protein, partial [Bacteroidetes bacterium]